MSFSPRARRRTAALSATLLTLVVAAPVLGHVSVPDGSAIPSGSTSIIHFRVPHGCDGAATDTIELKLPDGIVSAKPEYIPGWTVEVEMVESTPYDEFGTTRTERVGVIRWSGGDLPDYAYYDFGVRATFLLDPGTTVGIPVVQRCGDAEVAWIEPVMEGQPEPEHPTPEVTITDPLPTSSDD
jgi:periplasmic copper chaperone A